MRLGFEAATGAVDNKVIAPPQAKQAKTRILAKSEACFRKNFSFPGLAPAKATIAYLATNYDVSITTLADKHKRFVSVELGRFSLSAGGDV